MIGASGILAVDKPPGPTSHDVVQRTRATLGIRRVGHTGTLDPFASGLLLLCVGPATRLSEYLTRRDKVYHAVALLGTATTTHDDRGEVLASDPGWRDLTRGDVESALDDLRGTILQRPPAFSAKKVRGEPAHQRARRGEELELPPVEVTVYELDVTGYEPPELRLRIHCSSGTYIRALARDLGAALGVGAHLTALRRTAVGRFSVEEALSFEDLQRRDRVRSAMLPPRRAVEDLPLVRVDDEQARRLAQGQLLDLAEDLGLSENEGPVAVLLEERLVAVGLVRGRRLRPKKVFQKV